MGCCLSSTAVEPSSSSLHAATSASLPPHKHVKDPMLTSATKVGPEGSLEAHYKLVGNTLGCGRVASVREAVERATGAVVAVKACSKKVLNARPAYISRTIEIEALQRCYSPLISKLLSPTAMHVHSIPPSSFPPTPHLNTATLFPTAPISPFHAHLLSPWQLWAAPAPVAPPIIRLLATHEDSRHLHIVTDKAQGGDLFMALAARSSFTEADAAHIARQLLQAVALCHARGVTHRDLVRPAACWLGMASNHMHAAMGRLRGGRAGKESGGKESGGKESGGKESGGKESGGKESGGKKPENILLSDAHSLAIKLVDFGSAALFHPAPTTTATTTSTTISSSSSTGEAAPGAGSKAEQREGSPESTVQHGEAVVPGAEGAVVLRDFMGTAFYAAPEVWQHAYGPQADVWSAGAVVAVLLTGPPPSGLTRATVHSNATWQAMQKGIVPTLPRETSPAAQSFLRALLEPDPCQRPTAAHALLHPWLAGAAAVTAEGAAEGGAMAVTGDAAGQWAQPAVAVRGSPQARAAHPRAALLADARQASVGERATGAAAEAREEGTGKAGEEDGERGEREGEVAARRVGQEEEAVLQKGPGQGGATGEGRVRGGVQLEGSLRGFRLYAATRKLQRACVALLSLELSESEFRQLVRQLASATSAPGTSLEAVSEAGDTGEGQSDHRGEKQQQQQHQYPPSAMLCLPALVASLDALGHQRLSLQLMAVHSSVMAQQAVAPPSMVHGHAMTGVEREERVRGGCGIAAALEKQRQEQQQQQQQQQEGAATTPLARQPPAVPPSSSSATIPPVPLFDLLDFSALVTRHHDLHRLHHDPHDHHHPQSVAHAAAAARGAAGRGGRREGKGKGKMVSPESESKGVEAGSSHRGSRRFLGLMRAGQGEKEAESGGSVHGGSLHGSRRFLSAMRAREGEQHEGGGSQHGSRRFFGLLGGREQDEASSRAGGSQHGSRRFFSMMPGSGAPSPAAAGAPSPGGSLRGSFRMARRLGLLRTGGEEGEGEEEDMASPGADGDVVGAMGSMGAPSAAPLALRGPLSPRSPFATAHSDNAGGWARRLNARASAGGAGMTWQSPVGLRKSPLAQGVPPQSGGWQQGRGVVGSGASSGAATLPAAASAGAGRADRGGLLGGVGMLSCQRVQSCVDLAAMGGDESSPAARKGATRGWELHAVLSLVRRLARLPPCTV
ncbi:unnamed protein product [Closterium sp. NIES-64]|nr:unnamed protein product [Closterium sp. NIES-64]